MITLDTIESIVEKYHRPNGKYRVYNNGLQTYVCPNTNQECPILYGIPDATLIGLHLPCPIDSCYAFCAVDDDVIADKLHNLIISGIVNS